MADTALRLYHGTSSLFLDGIAQHGLGGLNPIADWSVLEFARAMYPAVQEHLSSDEAWTMKVQSFGYMVEQKSSAMNFQHGHTYLSASRETAIRYAVNSRFGSELLSYCHDLLDELLRREVAGIRDALSQEFPQVFGFRETSCAPVLVEADGVVLDQLQNEHGEDARQNFESVWEAVAGNDQVGRFLLQQINFRLTRPVAHSQLRVWLINVTRWDPYLPDCTLYPISLRPAKFSDDEA